MIKSVSEIIKIIELETKNDEFEIYFRGERSDHKDLRPSIYRNNFINSEDRIFKEFILRNPDEFHTEKSTFEKLCLMQHYSLPTRLLDITKNPLVALYFASQWKDKTNKNEEGCFIILKIPREQIKYFDSDTVSCVSNIARRPIDALDIKDLERCKCETNEVYIERFNSDSDIGYLLHEIKDEKPYFQNLIVREHLESVWCVKPLLRNRRIIRQNGAFLLFGILGEKKNMADIKVSGIETVKYKVSKKDIEKELNILGMTKDQLFPEMDSISEYLKSKYQN